VQVAVESGLDRDDLVQEVLMRLLAQERSTGGWNASRAGLSTYVWLVARSVVRDVLAARHVRRLEQLGARTRLNEDEVDEPSYRDGYTVDAAVYAEHAVAAPPTPTGLEHLVDEVATLMVEARGYPLTVRQREVLELVLMGHSRSEIRARTGMGRHAWERFRAEIGRAVAVLGGLGPRRP
jgi:DNA-directed RNA polymerase specialized sigma24 family protein